MFGSEPYDLAGRHRRGRRQRVCPDEWRIAHGGQTASARAPGACRARPLRCAHVGPDRVHDGRRIPQPGVRRRSAPVRHRVQHRYRRPRGGSRGSCRGARPHTSISSLRATATCSTSCAPSSRRRCRLPRRAGASSAPSPRVRRRTRASCCSTATGRSISLSSDGERWLAEHFGPAEHPGLATGPARRLAGAPAAPCRSSVPGRPAPHASVCSRATRTRCCSRRRWRASAQKRLRHLGLTPRDTKC